jgi:excisionase family DNA binding protein
MRLIAVAFICLAVRGIVCSMRSRPLSTTAGATDRSEYVSVSEAARLLQASPTTVWRWAASSRLPAYRVGPKTIGIHRRDLDAAIQPARRPSHADRSGRRRPRGVHNVTAWSSRSLAGKSVFPPRGETRVHHLFTRGRDLATNSFRRIGSHTGKPIASESLKTFLWGEQPCSSLLCLLRSVSIRLPPTTGPNSNSTSIGPSRPTPS